MADNPYASPGAAAPPPDPQKFALFDWAGVAFAGLTIARLVAFAGADWKTLFRDFGSLGELPLLTRIFLVPWVRIVPALLAAASLAMGFRSRRRQAQRRIWIWGAFIIALVGLALYVVAMYLPLFTLAGKIKPE